MLNVLFQYANEKGYGYADSRGIGDVLSLCCNKSNRHPERERQLLQARGQRRAAALLATSAVEQSRAGFGGQF